MRSKLTLMLVALLAMAGIATAQTPQEAKAAKQKAKQAAAARRASGTPLAGNELVQFYQRGDENFDIWVKHDGAWRGTTFSDGGYATYIKFDGSDKVQLSGFINAETVVNETVVNGIKVNLTAKVPSASTTLIIKYTVTNTTNETKTFKLGSCADTQLAGNDYATISRVGNVITMSDSGTGASYSLAISSNATDPASMWYGYYGDRGANVFNDTPAGTPYNGDSGLAWSWSITLAPHVTKVFIVGGGSVVDATVVDYTGAVSMSNYTYGAATNPSVNGYKGNPEITYYYNTTNSNQGGTQWSQDAGGSLKPGTYYMYAELAATDGYNAYTTDPVPFTVNPADNTGTVSMSNYTYGAARNPEISGYKDNPVITYYYNTTNSNQGGTQWSQDAGGSLNAGTYYMYAVLAATDCYNEYTTAPVEFTVNPIVYDAGSSSDAIDLEVVPDNLGALDGTNGPTDLAAFLEDYQKTHMNPPYIRLKLKADGNYIITRSLKTFSAIHILGDKDYPSHIDASQLGDKPFVIIDRNHQVNEKNEKGFLTSIYNVEFKDIVVTGLKGQVFYADQQKYLIPYFTVDNCVFRMEGASNKTFFDFYGGGFVENLTVTNSTLSGDNATGGFFSTQSGSTFAEAGAQKFTQTLTNNTFYNVAKGQTLSTLCENSKAWMSFTIKDNVIVNSGKNGEFVKGLNAGQNNGTPSWLIRNNSFTFDGADVSASEVSGASNIPIAANVTGQIVFANGDEGVTEGDFSLGACPQKEAKIGDPRWLNASKLSKYITMAEIDDDNDLAKTINYYVEQGFSKFRLEDNGRYTVKQSIVTDKAISITGENVQIDVEHSDPFIQLSTTPAEAAVNDYFRIDQMLLKGLEIKGIKNSIIYDNNTKYCVVDLTIDDCVLGLETEAVKNEALISFQAGGVKDFTIKNSTVYGNNAVAKYFIRYNNSARLDRYGFDKNTEFQTMTYQNNTFYGLLKSDGQWGNYNGIAGQNYSKFVVEKNIWYNSSNEIIRRMAGGRFGSNAPQTFDKNTYFLNGADNSAKEAGYDKSGTALTTDPGFKKPAEGDFTLSAYSAQCNEKTGDPRWLAEGGHYNPVTGIETVKTAEETSLENAVIYNLNGQRVEKAQKGINIVNGKKVIIK